MARSHAGFTLIEVLVSLALLTGSLLVLAQVMVAAARAADAARATTVATALAAQKIEQLRALAWGIDPDGSVSEDFECDVPRWPERPAGGSGLTPSPPEALDADTPGYVDYLDAQGRWAGEGSPPPGSAAFVRRWSIEAGEAAWPATLVLRVGIWKRSAPTRHGAVGWTPVMRLDTAKSRRAE
jgi:prepilin-type N-terminal cleavage/methylation domain-containing protein